LQTFGPLNIKKSLHNAWERPAKTRHSLHDHNPQIKLGEAPLESRPSHRLECHNEHTPSHFLACKTTFFLTSKGFTNYSYWFSFFKKIFDKKNGKIMDFFLSVNSTILAIY
jgi:hypothetical protein